MTGNQVTKKATSPMCLYQTPGTKQYNACTQCTFSY